MCQIVNTNTVSQKACGRDENAARWARGHVTVQGNSTSNRRCVSSTAGSKQNFDECNVNKEKPVSAGRGHSSHRELRMSQENRGKQKRWTRSCTEAGVEAGRRPETRTRRTDDYPTKNGTRTPSCMPTWNTAKSRGLKKLAVGEPSTSPRRHSEEVTQLANRGVARAMPTRAPMMKKAGFVPWCPQRAFQSGMCTAIIRVSRLRHHVGHYLGNTAQPRKPPLAGGQDARMDPDDKERSAKPAQERWDQRHLVGD